MSADLNFEAEPLLNEEAFGEASEEYEEYESEEYESEDSEESERSGATRVRDQRTPGGGVPGGRNGAGAGGPRVRVAPGSGDRSASRSPRGSRGPGALFARDRSRFSPGSRMRGPSGLGRDSRFRGLSGFGGGFGGPSGRFGFLRSSGFGGGFGGPSGRFGFLRSSGFGGPFGRSGFGRRFRFRRPFGRFGLRDASAFPVSAPVSELVSWAQGCLAQIGFEPLPQNGILGPSTRRAISAFQSQQQLAATGVLDDQTIAALQAACAPQGGGGEGDQADQANPGGE